MNTILHKFLNLELRIWEIIVISGVIFLLGSIVRKLLSKSSVKPLVSEEMYLRYCIKRFTLFDKEFERGMTVRAMVCGHWITGELIGMNYEQFILVATNDQITHIPEENITFMEILQNN
jgi:uncharacterized Fe-S cluster-containing radical SAM superfamily enzyme